GWLPAGSLEGRYLLNDDEKYCRVDVRCLPEDVRAGRRPAISNPRSRCVDYLLENLSVRAVRSEKLEKDVGKEPNVGHERSCKNGKNEDIKRKLEPQDTWRQRKGNSATTAPVLRSVSKRRSSMVSRVRDSYTQTIAPAEALQDRHSPQSLDDCCGSGWRIPQEPLGEGEGCSQGRVPRWSRVDRVEVLERRRAVGFDE